MVWQTAEHANGNDEFVGIFPSPACWLCLYLLVVPLNEEEVHRAAPIVRRVLLVNLTRPESPGIWGTDMDEAVIRHFRICQRGARAAAFSWDAITARYRGVYESVLNRAEKMPRIAREQPRRSTHHDSSAPAVR
jgi:hypothetical protein